MSYCLIFPGQGTQFPGMTQGLALEDILEPRLVRLMQEGPESDLSLTVNAQPAVLSCSIALWKKSGLEEPAMVMGHSLGEYSALVASGAISFEDGLDLVRHRAAFMADVQSRQAGAMAAVLGMKGESVRDAIAGMDDVWIANINAPDQVVISGKAAAIKAAAEKLKEAGARRVVPLRVLVAPHCPLMESARQKLAGHLQKISLKSPYTRIVFNATAQPESIPSNIKNLLAEQLVCPVRWEESVQYAASRGIKKFIEIGPKSVLASLVKKIVPEAQVEVRVVK
ncbi:MAG: ACP S-malonyltransferase [Deltaproteobacteria bacterium]|nr:ACP S-malonyltransferase [Deltaproteobacteria bacterium]